MKYNKEIGEIIGNVLSTELPDETTVEGFMNLLTVLDSTKVHFEKPYELINGACLEINKFLQSESLCKTCIKTVFSRLNDEEGKENFSFSNSFLLRT